MLNGLINTGQLGTIGRSTYRRSSLQLSGTNATNKYALNIESGAVRIGSVVTGQTYNSHYQIAGGSANYIIGGSTTTSGRGFRLFDMVSDGYFGFGDPGTSTNNAGWFNGTLCAGSKQFFQVGGGIVGCFVSGGFDFTSVASAGIRFLSGDYNSSANVVIVPDGAGILAQRNSTNAQTFRLYNTYTSTTSYERINIKGKSAANFEIGPENGSAGGTLRGLTIGGYSAGTTTISPWITIGTDSRTVVGTNSSLTETNTSNLVVVSSANIMTGTSTRISVIGENNYQDMCFEKTNASNTMKIWTFGNRYDTYFGNTSGSFGIIGTHTDGTLRAPLIANPNGDLILVGATANATKGFVGVNTMSPTAQLHVTQAVATTGSPAVLNVTGAAHTTLTLSTEATDVNFNLSRTVQFATGALTTQRAMRIQAPTYSFVGASTITTASTLSISGPPVAGTNATITNAYALNLENGGLNINNSTVNKPAATINALDCTGNYAVTINALTSAVSGYPYQNILDIYAQWAENNATQSGSSLFRVRYGSYTALSLVGHGTLTLAGYVPSLVIGGMSLNSSSVTFTDVTIVRESTGVLAQRNSTNAQTLRVYNTYTSATSYERVNIKGKASANFEIGPENGSAGGTLRGLTLGCYPAGTSTIVGWAQFRPNASTGAIEAFYLGPIADSTAVGGNTRGTYSVDLQTYRTAASQVASGLYAVAIGASNIASGENAVAIGIGNNAAGYDVVTIGKNNSGAYGGVAIGWMNSSSLSGISLGQGNTASGDTAVAIGSVNTASGTYSRATGRYSESSRYGMTSHASGRFAATGDAQSCGFVLRNKTTDVTPVNLGLNGSTTRLTIPSGKTMSGFLIVKGIKSDGSAKARFVRLCDITNVGGTTALDTPIEAIGTDYNPSGCTLAVTAENATDDLQVNITGPAGETWRWTATFSGLEIAYGT